MLQTIYNKHQFLVAKYNTLHGNGSFSGSQTKSTGGVVHGR